MDAQHQCRRPGGVLSLSERIVQVVAALPPGRVCTYGGVAALAGAPRAARQVVRVLHSLSERRDLPWHRVVGAGGRLSYDEARGENLQRRILESEGVPFKEDRVDLSQAGWP